jgi:hypothetical protein
MLTSRNTWLMQSANECAASASIAALPLTSPTRSFPAVMMALATSAATTTFLLLAAKPRTYQPPRIAAAAHGSCNAA